MKWLVFPLVLLFTSCSDKKPQELGRFVYVDCLNTIHIDRECASSKAANAKTKEERMIALRGVNFIDTCDIKTTEYDGYDIRFCPRCIDDETYYKLNNIIKRNDEKNNQLEGNETD